MEPKPFSESTLELPPFIKECLRRKIPVSLSMDERGMFFKIGGFYRHNTYDLWPILVRPIGAKNAPPMTQWVMRSSGFENTTKDVDAFSDLVLENLSEWKDMIFENDEPSPFWKDTLIEFGLIEEKTETRTFFRPR